MRSVETIEQVFVMRDQDKGMELVDLKEWEAKYKASHKLEKPHPSLIRNGIIGQTQLGDFVTQ